MQQVGRRFPPSRVQFLGRTNYRSHCRFCGIKICGVCTECSDTFYVTCKWYPILFHRFLCSTKASCWTNNILCLKRCVRNGPLSAEGFPRTGLSLQLTRLCKDWEVILRCTLFCLWLLRLLRVEKTPKPLSTWSSQPGKEPFLSDTKPFSFFTELLTNVVESCCLAKIPGNCFLCLCNWPNCSLFVACAEVLGDLSQASGTTWTYKRVRTNWVYSWGLEWIHVALLWRRITLLRLTENCSEIDAVWKIFSLVLFHTFSCSFVHCGFHPVTSPQPGPHHTDTITSLDATLITDLELFAPSLKQIYAVSISLFAVGRNAGGTVFTLKLRVVVGYRSFGYNVLRDLVLCPLGDDVFSQSDKHSCADNVRGSSDEKCHSPFRLGVLCGKKIMIFFSPWSIGSLVDNWTNCRSDKILFFLFSLPACGTTRMHLELKTHWNNAFAFLVACTTP